MSPGRILLVCARTVIDQGETVLTRSSGLLRGRQRVAQAVAATEANSVALDSE